MEQYHMGIELDLELPDVEFLNVSRDSKGNYVIELHSTKKKASAENVEEKLNAS
ncbi:MAG: hypothetical protein VSS75_013150 [Candidatus Parabeggiatoa sp.]|nr:hypothetical protein [Candidatus Parabeggiatoa sp.]